MAPGKHIYRATVEKENLHCWQNLDSVICRKIVLSVHIEQAPETWGCSGGTQGWPGWQGQQFEDMISQTSLLLSFRTETTITDSATGPTRRDASVSKKKNILVKGMFVVNKPGS